MHGERPAEAPTAADAPPPPPPPRRSSVAARRARHAAAAAAAGPFAAAAYGRRRRHGAHFAPRRPATARAATPRGAAYDSGERPVAPRTPRAARTPSAKRRTPAPALALPLSPAAPPLADGADAAAAGPPPPSARGVWLSGGCAWDSGLAGADAEYRCYGTVGVGSHAVVREARHVRSADPTALYILFLPEADGGGGNGGGGGGGGGWREMREELKRLVSLRAPHLMRVRGWYERRVLLDPSANPWGWSAAHEVAVSADLLLGGDLLQRATEQVYCEAHVGRSRSRWCAPSRRCARRAC